MIRIAPRDFALLILVTLLWGFNLVSSKVGLEYLPPFLFTALRFALVALLLLPFLRIRRGQMAGLAVAAVLVGALNFSLLAAGLALAPDVSSVAIVSQLGVPFTTLLGVALLGEVVHWRRWGGIALSFAGVAVMGFDPQITNHLGSAALVCAGAFAGSLGLIALKRLAGFEPLELQAWVSWVSWPVLLALSLLIERPAARVLAGIPWIGWASLAFSALGVSLIGHTSYYYLVRHYPVTSVAPLTVLSPLFSVAFGVWLLGDRLTAPLVLGGVFTLAGVCVILMRGRRILDTGS